MDVLRLYDRLWIWGIVRWLHVSEKATQGRSWLGWYAPNIVLVFIRQTQGHCFWPRALYDIDGLLIKGQQASVVAFAIL